MLLPGLSLPVSIDIFETNFEYFLGEYFRSDYMLNLNYQKKNILYASHRYCIYYENDDFQENSKICIGEIDVLIVRKDRIEIKAAVYNLRKIFQALMFFDNFYRMIYEKWQINPRSPYRSKGEHFSSRVATSTFIKLGISSGYYRLPGIISVIPNLEHLLDGETIQEEIHKDDSFYLEVNDSERNEIIVNYQSEINKGLVFHSDEEEVTPRRHDVSDKVWDRAKRCKNIKDKHPDWSQLRVVMEYNAELPEREQIEVYDLQNAYRAVGWAWGRAD